MFVASMNIQHTFSAARTNAAFANAGIGMFREGGAARSSLAASYGAGVGMRHRVHEDHGAIRAEVRGDYLNRSAEFGRPALTTIGLRLGFDLWL